MGEETMTWVAVGIGLVAVLDKLGTLWINNRRETEKQRLDTERALEVQELKAKIESQALAIAHASDQIRTIDSDRAELREELRQCEQKHERATALHEEAIARIAALEAAK